MNRSAPPTLHSPKNAGRPHGGRGAPAEEEEEDFLLPLDSSRTYQNASPVSNAHIKTYTAGEDAGRLADMAKEFGLQHSRNPRRQVRKQRSFKRGPQIVLNVLLDPSFEDIRMRAIFSAHDQEDGASQVVLDRWNASWADVDMVDEALEGEVEDPHASGLGGNLTSAVLGIIKGMVGPAILYLPHGFAAAGWLTSLPIMALATIMYLHASKCLLDSWKLQSDLENGTAESPTNSTGTASSDEERAPLRTVDDSATTSSMQRPLQMSSSHVPRKKHVLLSYPELAYRALGSTGENFVKTGIALMQSGVCLTYLIFVPQNLHTSMLILTGVDIPPSVWLIVMVGIQIPLSWIRDIRKFTMTNLLANVMILYGLLTCLGFALHSENSAATSVVDRWKNLKPFAPTWFLFIGTSVLLFEGSITLLVPLQEAVHKPQDRREFPTVYRRVILGIMCFYVFFGITCWMSFGDSVKTVLTTSLPSGPLATTVQLAYSVAVIFTFPLQNFPALEIACRSIAKGLQQKCGVSRRVWYTQRNFISSILVCLLALVAVVTMDSLDKVVSLMGSLLGCPLAFVAPPLIHSQLDPNVSLGRKQTNYAVAGLGFGAMVVASITTLLEW